VFAGCAAQAYSRFSMTRRSAMTSVAAVLIAALALLCLGDVAKAALPSVEDMGCPTRICDEQSGCGTAAIKSVALPVVALATPIVVTAPAAATLLSRAAGPVTVYDRQVLSLTPRSPPLL